MEYENDKQVIFLKDLLFAILYRWKGILLAIVIGAVLLGGFQFLQNKNNSNVAPDEIPFKQQQLQQRIAIKEIAVENQAMYLQESPLMNMDPYRVYKTNLSFYIHNNYQIQPGMVYQNPDNTPALLNTYLQLLSDVSLTKQISEATGINAIYVQELFSAQVSENSIPGVLTVVVTFDNEAKLEKIVDLTKAHLLNAAESLKEQLGEHTVRCAVTPSGLTTDTVLANQQKQAADQLGTLSSDLEKLQTQLAAFASTGVSRSVVIMAIIGALLGAVLVCGFAVLMHICSSKAYSVRTLANHTGITVIGTLTAQKKKNKIDLLLKKIEGRNIDTWENEIPLLAAYLKNIGCTEKIMLTGDGDCTILKQVAESLANAGIQAFAAESLLRSHNAMTVLAEANYVVLVEQQGNSKYSNIEKEISLLKRLNKPILGGVFIEN